jgi:signal transduction histidine kinase
VTRDKEPVRIDTVIQEGVAACRHVLEKTGCTVEFNTPSELPLVLADGAALSQVIQNLVENAAKHGGDRSKWIGISANPITNRATLSIQIRVTDRGKGIPRDERKYIFDPFFRGDRAMRDQIHGTGLGLNLVKQIVDAHGGA